MRTRKHWGLQLLVSCPARRSGVGDGHGTVGIPPEWTDDSAGRVDGRRSAPTHGGTRGGPRDHGARVSVEHGIGRP